MTRAQGKVYWALQKISQDGWPTTVRELSGETGLAVATVHLHLGSLESQGLVAKHPRNERGGVLPLSFVE